MVIGERYGDRIARKPYPIEIEEVISDANGEVEAVYNYIKKTVGFSKKSDQEKLRNAALKYYKERDGKFRFVRREHLRDYSLYSPAGGQARRDFVGKLLQKIANGRGLGEISARVLAGFRRKMRIDQKR
jgi:hypothetical protein